MRAFVRTNQFKGDFKGARKRGNDPSKLFDLVSRLAEGEHLERKHNDHALAGDFSDRRECHIEPDWLLIYRLTEKELILIRTGTHSDLFE